MINEIDRKHLTRCIELAEKALENGDEPFGSILVSAEGEVLAEDRNRVGGGDPTQHPEFALARWAAENMPVNEREKATVYTSGEHCPMCSSAHGFAGLGKIVYASSSGQLSEWMSEMGVAPSSVRTLSIQEIVPNLPVEGPVPELAEQVRELHRRFHSKNQ
ncbi:MULTISPECIES: nucleoside deaminase [unclassified Sporosarcina]|uniref:nucleoside deaminase n=1 Tax=unclassified Sporosarcina TaxID=2647733 RepID=UPI002041683F|nr:MULTISPECIES: nucleoside deaminase [unclassified Sporosarcina]GKV67276.1 putative cytidine/deoxycytidylate deaminase [Sporosarcina sp. NCCP-2331]GLB57627.1 putative cytidine/deoxycytidylate deaminase [Sporosarcina sp. NCCP-2378]